MVSQSVWAAAVMSDDIMVIIAIASIVLFIIILAKSVMYLLDFIVVGGYGDEIIIAVVKAVGSIIHYSVIVNIISLEMVVMTIKAEEQSREEMHIKFKRLGHIIIKLLAVWSCMHANNGTVEEQRITVELLFHEIEIWHCRKVVILSGIGVETNKFYPGSDEAEVEWTKHLLKHLFSGAEEVMIANKRHIRLAQFFKYGACPLKLSRGAAVCEIAAMYHEVYLRSRVDVSHHVFSTRQPVVGVAYECKHKCILAHAQLVYSRHVSYVNIIWSIKPHVIGMIVKKPVASHQRQQRKYHA